MSYGEEEFDDEIGEPSWLTDKFEEDVPPVADWSAEEEDDEMPALAESTARREEWQKLLDVPSYVETQAARFASADLSQLVAEESESF